MDYPNINIILDDRSPDDYGRLLGEFITQGITKYKFWAAVIDRKTVVESINASFKNIVARAKGQGYKKVIIAEQDLFFTHPKAWEYFLKNEPKEYDVYIAGSYLNDSRYIWEAPLVKVNEWVGNQLIIIHERYYDTFLALDNEAHIDTVQKDKGDFYVCYPFIGLQRAGFSRNNLAICDYNQSLRKEDIYKG